MSDFIFFEPVSLAARADFDEELLKRSLIENPERLGLGDCSCGQRADSERRWPVRPLV